MDTPECARILAVAAAAPGAAARHPHAAAGPHRRKGGQGDFGVGGGRPIRVAAMECSDVVNRYSTYEIKPQAVPIRFDRMLKVVALVDLANVQTKELLAQIAADGYQVEISDVFERDVTEDASVGAYIVWPGGVPLEPARALLRGWRGAGFNTPLWALADLHRLTDLPVVGGLGEVEGYIYLGQQSPQF